MPVFIVLVLLACAAVVGLIVWFIRLVATA